MEYCLCCGKVLKDNETQKWHKKCIYEFFHSYELPIVEYNRESLILLGEETVEQRKTITGVQQKLSFNFSRETGRLTLVGYPLGYILKPNSKQYPYIAESEHLVMLMAEHSKIDVAMHGLIPLSSGELAYITKRMDRDAAKKIHMEDFCQLANRPVEYKYSSSCEKVFKILETYSTISQIDKINLFERIVFNFIVGNSDMHLKNYSLIYDTLGNHLSKCYDLLPVQLLFKADKEETALTIHGKKKNLRKNDFLSLAESANIDLKIAKKIINKLCNFETMYKDLILESLLPNSAKDAFIQLIEERIARLR